MTGVTGSVLFQSRKCLFKLDALDCYEKMPQNTTCRKDYYHVSRDIWLPATTGWDAIQTSIAQWNKEQEALSS
jgi:hypothetical protein